MDFNNLATPESVGMDATMIAEIQRTVRTQIVDGLTPGSQVVVARHGKPVVDIALGLARIAPPVEVTPQTLFYSWSVAWETSSWRRRTSRSRLIWSACCPCWVWARPFASWSANALTSANA